MERIRLGLVDDQEAIRLAFSAGIKAASGSSVVELSVTASTVKELLDVGTEVDVVALDLSLNDGSSPAANVKALCRIGAKIIIYTVGDDLAAMRESLAAGAICICRKSTPFRETLQMIRDVAADVHVESADTAAAIDSDRCFVTEMLSEDERRVLQLRAAGMHPRQISSRTGIRAEDVVQHMVRILDNYSHQGMIP